MTLNPLPEGPAALPWLGQLPRMARDPLGFLPELQRRYGDLVRFTYGGQSAVLVAHPDHIEQVLLKTGRTYHKGYGQDPVLGNGLVNSEGDFWRRQRKLAQPAFHTQRIGAYAQTMVRFTLELLDTWRGGETRNLHADMMLLTQRIVAQTLFGRDVAREAGDLIPALDALLGEPGISLEEWLPKALPTPARRRTHRAVTQIETLLYAIVAERRAHGGPDDDLLAMLLAARDEDGQGMSDRQLRDELMTLYLAGHETMSNTLTFSWLLLAQHLEVRALLEAELEEVLAGRPPALEDLPRLSYADAVIREAMRLYPPVWAIAREASGDQELGGHAVPGGTQLLLSPWVTQRDPRWFPEPLTFRPGRWLDGSARSAPKYAYFPFGGGPRVCIGNSFAQMEAVLLLATIAGRFRLDGAPVGVPALEAGTTLRLRGGLPLHLVAR